MSTGKRIAIIVVTVVVVLAVAGIVAIDLVNRRAEREVTESIDETIRAGGMGDYVSYGSVDVQSARGTMEIAQVRITQPMQGLTMEFDSVSFAAPPAELVALMRNPETATLSRATMNVRGANIAGQPGAGDIYFGSLDLDVTGEFSQNIGGNPMAALSSMESMSLAMADLRMTPNEMMIAQLSMGGETPLSDEENWRVDTLDMDARVEDESIVVDSFDVTSPLVDLGAVGSIGLNEYMEPMPERAEITVREIDPALREMVSGGMMMFGLEVPAEGTFVFSYVLGSDGYPQFEIR